MLRVYLKYGPEGERVIRHISAPASPGLRLLSPAQEIRPVLDGLGISIISTSKGVMSDRKARAERLGGELLCHRVVSERHAHVPIGKQPVPHSRRRQGQLADGKIRVEGPKGKLELAYHRNMKVEVDDGGQSRSR